MNARRATERLPSMDSNISAGLDLLSYIGGLRFNNGIKYIFEGSPGKSHPAAGTIEEDIVYRHCVHYVRKYAST
jgi:hypothetical protein